MRADLEQAARVSGFFGLKKALRVADSELAADETVNAAGSVNLNGKAAVAVATNRRLLFVSAGLFRSSTSSIALPVAGVDRGNGKLTVHTPGGARTFKVVAGARGLEQAILNPDAGPVNPPQPERLPVEEHPAARKVLDGLAADLESGKISQGEHDEARARVLAKAEQLGL